MTRERKFYPAKWKEEICMKIMCNDSHRNTANENPKRCYMEPEIFMLILEFEEI